MAFVLSHSQKRLLTRGFIAFLGIYFLRYFFSSSAPRHEIQENNVLELVTRSDKTLDVQRHPFLQVRLGRDERDDLLGGWVRSGVRDYWERFQLPFMTNPDTVQIDSQVVRSSIDDLLALNGWVAAACPTLTRPFGQNKREDAYDELVSANHLYYIAIIIHSADHFLVDQLAVIVQLAKRLGTRNLFVSMLDYHSEDATPTLVDLSEAVLTLLGIPFRIRRVPPMTEDPAAAYYPLEEAYTRNLALEPLRELDSKRGVKFHRVIWLKGFTCPNDILETIKVSQMNEAAMVCGMDWAEHNGFFIFSDRWRTRDMDGDQFRLSRSSAAPSAGPPRDKIGSARYAAHLPFQVFCCESGMHVVDPAQSYYRGITYRSADTFHNLSTSDAAPEWDPDAPCMDSSQTWFCRDLWVDAAKDGVQGAGGTRKPVAWPIEEQPRHGNNAARAKSKREEEEEAAADGVKILGPEDVTGGKDAAAEKEVVGEKDKAQPQADKAKDKAEAEGPVQGRPIDKQVGPAEDAVRKRPTESDGDADVGSDFDAMPDQQSPPPLDHQSSRWAVPNSDFSPARILVNPRCVTTYAGVSHTQLALDLFGPDKDADLPELARSGGKYVLEDWEGAPDSFVCQEQRQTGGRKAVKTQRRLSFAISDEIDRARASEAH